MSEETWVFVVEKWETADGKNHVHWHIPKHETKTRNFKKWRDAFDFASNKAKELGLKQFQIDTPKHPHVFVDVDSKKGRSDA